MAAVTVVVATRDRVGRLRECLTRLRDLPERPEVVVVDNGSTDGTAAMVLAEFPAVRLARLPGNAGASARTVGVAAARTPVVAFADDDSGWEPGALAEAARLFGAYPRLALVAARILVGSGRVEDPVCAVQAAAPWGRPIDLPGPAVLGFLACAAVVRRSAFLQVGGFEPVLFFMAEEAVLSYDLTRAGWGLTYCPEVVAWHRPTPGGRDGRPVLQARNRALVAWLRRPLPLAARETLGLFRTPFGRRALGPALARMPWALARRLPPDARVEAMLAAAPW
jgi:GT2 family glycosyltransferase